MNITPLSPSPASTTASTTTAAGSMGGDQFMQLLLAEMKHQDPLNPMSNSDMMNQITQINSLQAMDKVSSNMQSLTLSNQMIQAANLIGKTINYAAPDGTTKSGVVSGVTYHGTQIGLSVGDTEISLAQLTGVEALAGLQQASHG